MMMMNELKRVATSSGVCSATSVMEVIMARLTLTDQVSIVRSR